MLPDSPSNTHLQTGFILTRQQIERDNQTFLEFWFATESGAKRLLTPAEQFVLFIKAEDETKVRHLFSEQGIAPVIRSIELKSFQHDPVCAIYLQTNHQLFSVRDCLTLSDIPFFEDDIRLSDRYLMERFIYGSATFTGQTKGQLDSTLYYGKLKPGEFHPSFKVLSLDIECSEHGELYSIGLAAKDFNAVVMIGDGTLAEHQNTPKWMLWVANERELLLQFCTLLNQYDPDIIVGWSVVNFDFRLLVKRAEKHRIKLKIGRGNSPVRWREPKGGDANNQAFIVIPGRIVIDGIDALKTATYHFDSFSLESVSQELLGKGKKIENVHDRMAHINYDFKHNKIKLAEYNLQDCILVLEIFEHTKLIEFLILRSQLTGLELDRVGGSVAAFTNLYLPKLHRAGYISPNRPSDGGLASPGGYVMSSRPGLYDHVLVLDFKSLYPSIIRTFKIDPLGLVEGLAHPEEAIPGFKGALFDRKKHFLPDIITSL